MIYNSPVSLRNLNRMRVLLVAAIVLIAALAGCSGKKGGHDELHYTCPDGTVIHGDDYEGVLENITTDFLKTKCPKAGGVGSKTNTTNSAPNVLPVLKLNITDAGGNATNVTLKDGNLTFDATGSFDPDGVLSAIAISVKDSNQTRTKPLYDLASKKFSPATFKFDRVGPVNVSIAMVDDRAGFNTTTLQVFVNEMQHLGGDDIVGGGGSGGPAADACKGASGVSGPLGGTIFDSYYFKAPGFNVVAGAQFIEAIPGSNNLVTICDPAGNAISSPVRSDAPVTSTNTEPLAPPPATDSYYIGIYAKPSPGQVETSVDVIIHYEPRPAAAAA